MLPGRSAETIVWFGRGPHACPGLAAWSLAPGPCRFTDPDPVPPKTAGAATRAAPATTCHPSGRSYGRRLTFSPP
jgi:hypothetical protein